MVPSIHHGATRKVIAYDNFHDHKTMWFSSQGKTTMQETKNQARPRSPGSRTGRTRSRPARPGVRSHQMNGGKMKNGMKVTKDGLKNGSPSGQIKTMRSGRKNDVNKDKNHLLSKKRPRKRS